MCATALADGHQVCLEAVDEAFGLAGVDYAMLVKLHGEEANASKPEARHSPGERDTSKKHVMVARPNKTQYLDQRC